jgi:NADH-quinone oxidoreductase subunit M
MRDPMSNAIVRMGRKALLLSVLWALALFCGTKGAAAEEAAGPRGQIALTVDGSGPLELSREGEGYSGKFLIENVGAGPLKVTQVAVLHSADDPRVPPGVSAELEGGSKGATLAPGDKKSVTVRWNPGAAKAKELYGHVVVESDAIAADPKAPARPVAMGIHAERGAGLGFIGDHILTIMMFLPLLGVLLIFLAHVIGYKDDKRIRDLTVVIQGVNLLLGIWLYFAFDQTFGKVDGNNGYQFIEHAVWIRSLGVEYFVGVDGISISMVLLTALISFVGALASFSVKDQLKGYFAMYNLLVTGMFGVFIALDLFMFYVFWEVMLLPMYFLIGIWGGPRRQYAAIKFFLYTLAGSVFMLLAFIWFYLHGEPSFLVDGASATTLVLDPRAHARGLGRQGRD